MLTVQKAVAIATRAHEGQMDKNGVTPYIEHPLAVMTMVESDDEKIVAVLHDVLEDTSITPADLAAEGATPEHIEALLALTRRHGEPYREYVSRALENPLARVVKAADHRHNTDPRRLALLAPEVADRLRRKYAQVAELLAAAPDGDSSSNK